MTTYKFGVYLRQPDWSTDQIKEFIQQVEELDYHGIYTFIVVCYITSYMQSISPVVQHEVLRVDVRLFFRVVKKKT